MPMTEAAFNSAYTVLFRTKIVHGPGWDITVPEGKFNEGQTDVIDLNHNNYSDWRQEPAPPYHTYAMYTEPALSIPYKNIKNEATALNQGAVLTQSDLANLMVEDFGMDFGNTNLQPDNPMVRNVRPLYSVAAQLAPVGQPFCAINTNTDEFMVYVAK